MSTEPAVMRQLMESHLSQMADRAEELLAEARVGARREMADRLNQAGRRIAHAASLDELAATLEDAAGAFAGGAMLFRIEDGTARSEKAQVALEHAPALRAAIETRDPVVAAAAPGEVSAELVELLGHAPEDRVSVFPVTARGAVRALVYAWGDVQAAAMELLTQIAGGAWTALLAAAAVPPPNLVNIAAEKAGRADAPARQSAWDALPPAEQQLHLRAQRFARVQAAEMRLFQAAALQAGRAHKDIYGVLRTHIDAAREKFRADYFSRCGSMVDYLHLELVRTLANDDPESLGADYPGPLV